jgi:glucan phosphoethanolaminetransferase (alkaline phosphatase superfamily)
VDGISRRLPALNNQTIGAVLIFLAFLAERPYVFFRYPGVVELSSWPKVASLVLFILAWWFVCLLLYLYAARSRSFVKWSIFLLLAVSSTFFDLYALVSGGAPLLYADYVVLVDAIDSSGDALAEHYPLLMYPAARLAVLFLAFLLMEAQPGADLKAVSLLGVSVLAFAGICVLKHGTHTNLLPGTTGAYGLAVASIFDSSDKAYAYSGAPQPSRDVGDMNIVLVIDESIRTDFLTGSDLDEIVAAQQSAWRHYDFGAATSAGNCSASSNIMLRKGVRPDSITDDLYRNPLIWSYARNAGFSTYLLDAQRNGRGHNHFDPFELELVSVNIEASHLRWDHELLDLMKHLEAPGKTFTLVIKKGAHFPYDRNFPAGHEIEVDSEYVAADEERLAYAKAVDWQTKGFLKKLVSLRVDKPTLVLYTADHGQNLNDSPGASHCTVSGTPFLGEGYVPLIALANYEDERLVAARQLNFGELSHFHIFPTIAEYMGFRVEQLEDEGGAYPPPLFQDVMPLNKFTYGDAFGRFEQPVKFLEVSPQREVMLLHGKNGSLLASSGGYSPCAVSTSVRLPPYSRCSHR